MSSHKHIEKIKRACLKSLKTNHRRVIFFKSNLQSFLKQTMIVFWQQKNKFDHNASRFFKQQFFWTKNHVFKSTKLFFYHFINQNFVESIKASRKLSNKLIVYEQNIEQNFIYDFDSTNDFEQNWKIEKIVNTKKTKTKQKYKIIWINIWINEKNMKNSTNLISEFWYEKRVKIAK